MKLSSESLTLQEKDNDTLTATVEPADATNKDVTWASSDNNIATVSEDGTVTAISAGNATITATAADGSGISASCNLTVTHGNMIQTPKKDVTCTEEGNTEYWYCETCKKYFSDSEGKNEIAPESTVIPATGHSYENGKCTVCGAIDPNFTPEIIAGANGTWQKGTQDGLSFTSNAAFDDFIKVQVDGKDLDASNYTTKEGSTIVTLKASYLETLSVGKHTLAIVSDTGIAETEFTILAASNSDESLVQTGDNNMSLVALLSIIGAMSAVIGVVALRKSRL
ncbi:MAG TPA: Ig-like domain-containing protein [Eggerthellaceae bacterium]|nr:Ig-like domain-containing protein [Eggerthellaceae bacterium]